MKEIQRGDTEFALSLRNAINELLADKEVFRPLRDTGLMYLGLWTKNKAPSGD